MSSHTLNSAFTRRKYREHAATLPRMLNFTPEPIAFTLGPIPVYWYGIGYALGLLFAAMYVAVNLAVIGFYWRERRSDFSPLKHLVIPILGILLLIPAFLGVLGGLTIPLFDIKLDPLKTPYDIVPLLVLIWMILGVVAYFWLRSRSPDALTRVGDVMTEG